MQLLQVENAPVRMVLVELLTGIQGKRASEALALRALFDLSPEVRKAAVKNGLANRPMGEYLDVLLEGFRYPWAAAAVHAANAVLDLKDAGVKAEGLLPGLVELLNEPNPQLPFVLETERKPGQIQKILAVRELVRINHMSNCMVCHAPSSSTGDLVRGRVPIPNEDPPPLYYAERNGSFFIRADITFLRQDFSVVQPMAQPGKWPGEQRFDYMARVRPVFNKEKMKFEALKREDKLPLTSPQRDALLFTLRNLTNKDLGTTYEDWKPLIKGLPVKALPRPSFEDLKPVIKAPPGS
jgi:hypothetical protein